VWLIRKFKKKTHSVRFCQCNEEDVVWCNFHDLLQWVVWRWERPKIKHKWFENCKLKIISYWWQINWINSRECCPNIWSTYQHADFIMNKTCTLKDMGVIKHYSSSIKKITKISIEDVLDDLLIKKRRRTELDVTKDEQLEQQSDFKWNYKRQTKNYSSGLHNFDHPLYVGNSLLLWQ